MSNDGADSKIAESIITSIKTDVIYLKQVSKKTSMKELEKLHFVDMVKYTLKTAWINGYGLAAIQIGLPLRAAWYWWPGSKDGQLLINPVIIKKERPTMKGNEGCLSIPNKFVNTKRYEIIELENNGQLCAADGLEAQIIQHECLSYKTIVETEKGKVSVKNLVNGTERATSVLGFKDGNIKFFPILSLRSKSNNCKKWVSVNFHSPKKGLVCTEDHLCAYINNILLPGEVKYCKAEDLKGKFVVRIINNRIRNHERSLYSGDQMQIIIGTLFGDGCVSSRGEVIITHGYKQKLYLEFISKILGGRIKSGLSGFNNDIVYKLVLPVNAQTKYLRDFIYSGGNKKVEKLVNYLTPLSLAVWYMDDGCLVQGKYAQLHTESYSFNQLSKLVFSLNKKFGVKFSITKRTVRSKIMYMLFANTDNSIKFFKLISNYIHYKMVYKLPDSMSSSYGGARINPNNLNISACKVSSVNIKHIESKLYDIKVGGSFNFFANGTLVHNCDHMDGILITDRVYVAPPGRNEPCPCGSGKKYKKCCISKI